MATETIRTLVIIGSASLLAVIPLGALWGALRTAARPTPRDDNAGWGEDDWFMKF